MRPAAGVLGEECFPFLSNAGFQLINSPGPWLLDISFYDAPNVFSL